MNQRHLSFVLQVAELTSFSAAAIACNVTQPTLSAGVRQIEERLGALIFDRSTRRVALTQFGRDIQPAIREAIASAKALEAQAKALLEPQGKMVRVGVSPIVEVSKAVDLMAQYRARHPDVEFVFKECFVDDLEARMTEGKVDIAIWPDTAATSAILSSVPLYSDPWVFLPNAANIVVSDPSPRCLSDIAEQSLILTSGHCGLSQATRSMFERSKLELILYPGRALSYSAIEEWADLGLGAALMPASKVSRARKGVVIPILNEDRSAAMLNIVASWKQQQTSQHSAGVISYLKDPLKNR